MRRVVLNGYCARPLASVMSLDLADLLVDVGEDELPVDVDRRRVKSRRAVDVRDVQRGRRPSSGGCFWFR